MSCFRCLAGRELLTLQLACSFVVRDSCVPQAQEAQRLEELSWHPMVYLRQAFRGRCSRSFRFEGRDEGAGRFDVRVFGKFSSASQLPN